MVSTYALLKSLKPESTIETEVFGDFDGDSTVTSDVVFKGSGDPFLVSERLWTMVQELKEKGIYCAPFGPTYVRFVTHLGFDDEALQAFSERISE